MNKSNDQKSNVKNPNSKSFQDNNDNRSVQLNPNNSKYRRGEKLLIEKFITGLKLDNKIKKVNIINYIQKELNSNYVKAIYFNKRELSEGNCDFKRLQFYVLNLKYLKKIFFTFKDNHINKIEVENYRLSNLEYVNKEISIKKDEKVVEIYMKLIDEPIMTIDQGLSETITLLQTLEIISTNKKDSPLDLFNEDYEETNSLTDFYYSLIKVLNN